MQVEVFSWRRRESLAGRAASSSQTAHSQLLHPLPCGVASVLSVFRSRSSQNLILLLFENMDVWKCFLINHLHSTFASIAVPESFLFECFESVMIIDKDCFKNWIFHKCDKIISHPYFIEITRGGFCLINVGVDPCHCWQCRVSSSCQCDFCNFSWW